MYTEKMLSLKVCTQTCVCGRHIQSAGMSTLYLKPLMRISKLDWRTISIPVDLAILVPSVLYRATLCMCVCACVGVV